MAQFSCSLCHTIVQFPEFDLEKTITTYSNTPLLTLLQNCTTETFVMENYLICKVCYLLLVDLDSFKFKAKTIEDKLKNYLRQYYKKGNSSEINQFEIIINKQEECRICYKKINSKNLKNHLKTHSVEINELDTTFELDEVNLSDISPSLEEMHLININETQKKSTVSYQNESGKEAKETQKNCLKPYNCSQCSKKWKTLAELKNHLSSHNKEKPYICEICGQAYKKQQALTIHVGMHNGINPFTCIYCKKSFTQKGALVRHIPIHTGELPFQCDLCGKRFVHHTSFNMHKLSHSGKKSYKCEICDLKLMSGSHLKRHMRVHTGEKKFTCNTCGKKFAEKYNLAVHEKLHLGISSKKKYHCHICDNYYSGQVKLGEHLLNVHQKVNYPDNIQKTYTLESVKCE